MSHILSSQKCRFRHNTHCWDYLAIGEHFGCSLCYTNNCWEHWGMCLTQVPPWGSHWTWNHKTLHFAHVFLNLKGLSMNSSRDTFFLCDFLKSPCIFLHPHKLNSPFYSPETYKCILALYHTSSSVLILLFPETLSPIPGFSSSLPLRQLPAWLLTVYWVPCLRCCLGLRILNIQQPKPQAVLVGPPVVSLLGDSRWYSVIGKFCEGCDQYFSRNICGLMRGQGKCVCVCVYLCRCMHLCGCMYTCVHVWVHVHVPTLAEMPGAVAPKGKLLDS